MTTGTLEKTVTRKAVMLDEPYDFYEDMDRGCGGSDDWLDNAGLAAIGLRKLAEEI